MVQYQQDQLDAVFGALSDPSRRAIVKRLAGGRASVSDLASPLQISLPGVMKHVRVLEGAGLLSHHKEGRVRWCELVGTPLEAIEDWLDDYRVFWDHRLDSLVEHFNRSGDT
jgi:DNA-binding transcriptional ArsR family regulator